MSNQTELAAHPLERAQREIEVIPGVCRGELAAHARVSLRYNGIAKTGHEDALREQQLAHLDRLRRLAQNHGDYRRSARERLEAERAELLAEVARVFVQPGDQLGVALDVAHRGEGAPGDGGRQRVGEQLGPGAL